MAMNTNAIQQISIHASAKEATRFFCHSSRYGRISIHASAKEATGYADICHPINVFQSTPPRRRRRFLTVSRLTVCSFQSTPPRRRRPISIFLIRYSFISIHASAKEATATYCDTSAIMYISSLNNFFVHYF